MNLLMVYTGKMRSSGKYEIWEEGVLCNVDRNHRRFVVVIDHFRNVKGIQLIVKYNIENEEGIRMQGKGNYYSKLKEES